MNKSLPGAGIAGTDPATGRPRLSDCSLAPTEPVLMLDQDGVRREVPAALERALTIKVDGEELVTLMTIGTCPELLVLGYLRNQRLVESVRDIESVMVDWERELADVATRSGRGVSARQNDAPPRVAAARKVTRDDLYRVVGAIGEYNAVYRDAGSVHGCGLTRDGRMLSFVEDVGRHNATDAISGWMWLNDVDGAGTILYSTGRLTTEIVDKAALMGIPVVISRNGVTRRAVELARESGVMLVARARRRNFQVFSCHDRLVVPGVADG